jgi:protein-tyrosine-phosphatase
VNPGPVRVLLLSEGNVCRSVLAEAMLAQRLQERGLGAVVRVESKGMYKPHC